MLNLNEYKNKILTFWFSEKSKSLWFAKNVDFDQELTDKFFIIYKEALSLPDNWNTEDIKLILALVILFDQFPRNMFRGKADAFATDHKALNLTKYSIKKKLDDQLTNNEHKQFLYMPLMHSECLDDQKISLEKFSHLGEESYKFAIMHKDVINRYGRFPGRNEALKRQSTGIELDFLKEFNHF